MGDVCIFFILQKKDENVKSIKIHMNDILNQIENLYTFIRHLVSDTFRGITPDMGQQIPVTLISFIQLNEIKEKHEN